MAEYAALIFDGDFRAKRIARSSERLLASFSFSLLRSFLNFFIADFITGTLSFSPDVVYLYFLSGQGDFSMVYW